MSDFPGTEHVHVGADGWLFLVGGANNAIKFYTTPDFLTVAPQWLGLLAERQAKCAKLGIRYFHLIAPEKLTIYPEKYKGTLPHYTDTPAISLPLLAEASDKGDLLIDALNPMKLHKDEDQLYWRTDTHWTPMGCYRAYEAICKKLDAPPLFPSASHRILMELNLDLGGKLSPPVSELFYVFRHSPLAKRISVNAIVSFKERLSLENEPGLHVGSNVVFVNYNSQASAKRVIIFGDSFCEYRSHLLTGMMAETFRELHFVWSADIDWAYVERVRPDIVLTETTERFMGRLPSDDFDVDVYAVKTLQKYLPS